VTEQCHSVLAAYNIMCTNQRCCAFNYISTLAGLKLAPWRAMYDYGTLLIVEVCKWSECCLAYSLQSRQTNPGEFDVNIVHNLEVTLTIFGISVIKGVLL